MAETRYAATLFALLALAACGDEPMGPRGPDIVPQALVVTGDLAAKAVAAGAAHTCAIKADDTVRCWGGDFFLQATVPRGLGTVKQLASGRGHTCAIRTDDTVVCWGDNDNGQSTVPAGLGTVKQIAAGWFHTCAIKTDDTVQCWGSSSAAGVPAGLGTVQQVSAGWYHTCAVDANSEVACWGSDADGQISPPNNLGTITQVAAGRSNTCAIRTTTLVRCWGSDFDGESSVPSLLGSVRALSAGAAHMCAIKTTDVLVCWGYGGNGQTTNPAGLGTVSQVATGDYHTCAVEAADSILACWGMNHYGQIVVPEDEHYLPSATFAAPATANYGQIFELELSGAQVTTPAGTFTAAAAGIEYAFDCGDGAGYGAFSSTPIASCTAGAAATQVVKGKVQDEDGDAREYIANVTVYLPPPAPFTVSLALATSPDHQLTVVWDDVADETSYQVRRRSRAEGGDWSEFTLLTVVSANTTSHEEAGLAQSMTYQYRVRSCNAVGCSAYTTSAPFIAGVIPGAPASLTATGVAAGAIDLAWTDSEVASRFEVQRRRKDAAWSTYTDITSLPAGTFSYSDTGLELKTHQYRVRVCNPLGCSAWTPSNTEIANAKPVAPANVAASPLSATSVQVSWTDASNNETSFTLQRWTWTGGLPGTWGNVSTPAANATSATDNTAAATTTYQYRVRASNAVGASVYVNSNVVTTP